MWKGKRVKVDKDDYLCMAYGEKVLSCRHGSDQHANSKENYKKKQDVCLIFVNIFLVSATQILYFVSIHGF